MNSKCVLLVDDNKNFMESAIKFLTTDKHFAVVGWAFTATEAFEKNDKFKPDLILMDLSLPDMNGFEAARILKQKPDAPKIIILSFDNYDDYSIEAMNAGADGYLCKSDFGSKIIPLTEELFSKEKSNS